MTGGDESVEMAKTQFGVLLEQVPMKLLGIGWTSNIYHIFCLIFTCL